MFVNQKKMLCLVVNLIFMMTALSLSFFTHAQSNLFEAEFSNNLNGFSADGRVYTSSSGVILRGSNYSDGSMLSPAISTEGHSSINISYTRTTSQLSPGERFVSEVSINGSSFTILETVESADGHATFQLPEEFENQTSIYIRFSIDGSGYFDSVTIRDLAVSVKSTDCEGEACCQPSCEGDGVLPASSVFSDGPFSVSTKTYTGPRRRGWIVAPVNLGGNDIKHPVIILAPDSGTRKSDYEIVMRRLASHGFVVYIENSTENGEELGRALDWILDENLDPYSQYFQKLSAWKVGIVGHGRGSRGAFNVRNNHLMATVHVAGGSTDGKTNIAGWPILYIGGSEDLDTPLIEKDYSITDTEAFFTVLDGVGRRDALEEGLPAVTAWFRWRLADESYRATEDFFSPICTFCTGMWESQYKGNEYWE